VNNFFSYDIVTGEFTCRKLQICFPVELALYPEFPNSMPVGTAWNCPEHSDSIPKQRLKLYYINEYYIFYNRNL